LPGFLNLTFTPMNIIVKSALGLVAAGILITLAVASQRPDTFEVSRSRVMPAPPERLFPLINDLHQFNVWSPYNAKDPKIKIVYSGASTGPGSSYTFEGDQNVGKGALGITASTAPSQVTMQLDMLEPMEGHNTVVFSLQPEGSGTKVTWAMHGPAPFISKLIGLVFNMDQMIGQDFETGLTQLQLLAEKA